MRIKYVIKAIYYKYDIILRIENVKDNKRTGKCQEYNDNGKIIFIGTYINDNLEDGYLTWYYN